MEKSKTERAFLGGGGVNKPKKPTRKLLKRVVDYLKSDHYMFAPLISSPPSGLGQSKMSSYSATGFKIKQHRKRKQKRLVRKIVDYLKADSFMYAPIAAPPPPISSRSRGQFQYTSSVSNEVSVAALVTEDNQPATCMQKDKYLKCNYADKKSIPGQQASRHRETVKHMAYQNCRSSTADKQMLNSKLRKVIVN